MAVYLQTIEGSLTSIECDGSNYRKNFTIQSDSDTSFNLYLGQMGPSGSIGATAGPFSLFPGAGISGSFQVIPVSLFGNRNYTFSVSCENPLEGYSAYLYTDLLPVGIIEQTNYYPVINTDPSNTLTFTVNNPSPSTLRENGSLSLKDQNGNPVITKLSRNFAESTTSFALARTNPALTGNVKITVDSTNNIWLNSFDATTELSHTKYKKFRIGANSSYASDLYSFFDSGTTPTDTVFALYQEDSSYTSTKTDFSQQYDRFYQYGVAASTNQAYTEEFSLFAPFYLKNDVPDYFVVFRTEGPLNQFSYTTPVSEWPAEVVSEILSSSTIIKTFSLQSNTQIGSYLRNIVNNPNRMDSEITVSFQPDGYTMYNGVSYSDASITQKGELLYNYFNNENPIISTEQYITQGFQRNGIISSHVMNMEFLFDDPSAPLYSINRYFGLYVNALDLAKFSISSNGFYQFSKSMGQLPIPRIGVDATVTSQASFTQHNQNGIRVYIGASSVERNLKPNVFTSLVSNVTIGATSFTLSLPGNLSDKLSTGDICVASTLNGATGSCILEGFNYSNDVTTAVFSAASFTGLFPINDTHSLNFYSDQKFSAYNTSIFDNTFVENSGRIFYLKDNLGNLHNVLSTRFLNVSTSDSLSHETLIEAVIGDNTLDLTTLTGFTDIITQTPAKVLPTVGNSSLYVTVDSFFAPNDFMEIFWENGPTSSGYPLRWRVVANESSLNPGETWPTCGMQSDSDGEYYFTYFHPGNSTVTMETFVKSIEDAFNRFSFKNFQVLAKGTTLYFKSEESGLASEKSVLTFSNHTPSLTVMGIKAPSSGSVNFIGASDRTNVRAGMDRNVANGMQTDEYISTQGNFSLAREYKIFDEIIVSAPYLEEPVYDSTGEKLVDFKNCDIYHTVVLDDESQPIRLTSDKKLTSYQIFKPTYGILSMLPFKDFDNDFILSDYTKNYTPELIEYFGRYASPLTVTAVNSSVLTFSTGVTFSSYPYFTPFLLLGNGSSSPQIFNEQQLKFSSAGSTAMMVGSVTYYSPTVGDTLLLMPDRKSLYFLESELAKFKGFFSVTSLVTANDEAIFNQLENLWDPSRFTQHLLNSEYDRLAENYMKSLALVSRVVPYITKWVYNGKDIRGNAYRFNYSRAFGTMNFSPSLTQHDVNPIYHTHEWPYLDSVPDTFPITDTTYSSSTFSYMFDQLSEKYDFTSTSFDWFSEYFTTGYPTEQYFNGSSFQSYPVDTAEKYSTFSYQSFSGRTYTMFRGQKIEIVDNTSTDASKYDGYRFSVVMKLEHSDFLNNEDPVTFNTVVNEAFNFIVVIVTVRTSSYRFPNGKLSYTDLYTLDSTDFVGQILGQVDLPYFQAALPNDYKLSQPIDLATVTGSNFSIYPENGGAYNTDLTTEILPTLSTPYNPSPGTYNPLVACLDSIFQHSVSLSNPVNVYSNSLSFSSDNAISNFNGPSFPLFLPSFSYDWNRYQFFHEGGGDNALLGLRDRLSFFEISNVMTNVSSYSTMAYDIYGANGAHATSPTFSFNMVAPDPLIRPYDYIAVPDPNKPPMYSSVPEIAAVLQPINNLQTINRYPGDFSPKFRDVLKFWMRESEDFTTATSTDFLLCNTHFGVELSNFGILKNQYFYKVADNEVISIASNSGFSPVYPLIGEVAIDKRDLFAWNSSWDKSYYRKYSSTISYQDVDGTQSMTEIKSLFGSKSMKVPSSFSLYQFETVQVSSQTALDSSSAELTYLDLGTKCMVKVNAYNRLLREMMGTTASPNAQTEFLKAMNIIPETFSPSTVQSSVQSYLTSNIMKLYVISGVSLWILQTGNSAANQIATTKNPVVRPVIETTLDSSISSIPLSLSQNALIANQYIVNNNAKVDTVGNLIFEIDYPFDSRYYTSLSIGVSLTRI